jgi:hypothetical protein
VERRNWTLVQFRRETHRWDLEYFPGEVDLKGVHVGFGYSEKKYQDIESGTLAIRGPCDFMVNLNGKRCRSI